MVTINLLLGGCANAAFVHAARQYHAVVGDDYIQYINADEDLNDTERISRVYAHWSFGQAIEKQEELLGGKNDPAPQVSPPGMFPPRVPMPVPPVVSPVPKRELASWFRE